LEAVHKLQQALTKNYYKTFLISLNDNNDIDFNLYDEWIIYKGEEYIEKNLNVIKRESRKIISDIKPIYIDANSEIYLTLANLKTNEEKFNYLTNTVRLINIAIAQLQKDMFIDNTESNYYSKINNAQNFISFNDVLSEFINMTVHKNFNDKRYVKSQFPYDSWDFEYFYLRTEYLSLLPTSLYTIANCFLNILQNILDEITSESTNILINEEVTSKLNWNSKPAHLGYLLGILADLDYIDAPKRQNGDINYTQFAKEVLQTFKLKKGTEATLTKYLNTTTEKAQETERNFRSASFNIPHKKEVS
jgi:hypothetical protein